MKKGGPKLKRKESDEWLCSSTYQPNQEEIVQKNERNSTKKKKKLKLAVVVPRKSSNSSIKSILKQEIDSENVKKLDHRDKYSDDEIQIDDGDDVDILNVVSTSEIKTPTSSMAKIRIITPVIPLKIARHPTKFSPPILQIRQSPEQYFAALTPKRRRSADVVQAVKRRKEDKSDSSDSEQKSDTSEVSNIFDTFSPIKTIDSPQKTKFSLDFITGYEAQFTAFEDTQPPICFDYCNGKNSPDLFDDVEDPMSIYEESEAFEVANCNLEASPFKIEVSPEKIGSQFRFEEFEEVEKLNVNCLKKSPEKKLRFAEPDEPTWDYNNDYQKTEHFIEESCGLHLQNSVFREYAIDIETCGPSVFIESTNCAGPDDETQKYKDAESGAMMSNSSFQESQEEDIYDRDELTGLSARFASLMSSKASERRLLMSDVVFGTVPKNKLVQLDCTTLQSVFGMSILGTSSSSVIISRSSTIRRLASCSPPPPPAPFVCDSALNFPLSAATAAATIPSLHRLSPISTPISVIYSIGAVSGLKPTITIRDNQKQPIEVVINPPLVSEGAF